MSASVLYLTDAVESPKGSMPEFASSERQSRCDFQRFLGSIISVIVSMLAMSMFVGSAQAATGSMGEISADVTDPQNLLGGNVSHVNDEIASTKQETGVTVRLLYLADFNGTKDPDKWAGESLQSTKPPANTVLLAVASNDGRLVVAVSNNSDNWLKDKDHVSELSQAALRPIQKGDNPDWSGSASAMMDEIKVLHRQEASKKPKLIIGISVAVLVVLIAIAVVIVLRRRKPSKKGIHENAQNKGKMIGENAETKQTNIAAAEQPAKAKAKSRSRSKGPRHSKKK